MPRVFAKAVEERDFACVDLERFRRRGFPEVVYCPGKTKEQIREIAGIILKQRQPLLLTRLNKQTFLYLKKFYSQMKYNQAGRIAYVKPYGARKGLGKSAGSAEKTGTVGIVCAGTSDIPIAEEAAATLEFMDNRAIKLYDVGVAGVHRVLRKVGILRKCRVIIVIAGMEGALASIVSGLVACPVIAVPTSIGYGANFSGLAPLLTMLNACSPGVSVVNIDNGFGAAYFASLVIRNP
ncbi:MAG: nickel pincer cofactor biosynthesis protein LarB [Candidatus Omnitrophota bacterium]